ncbi:MAG: tetratricopeptide repeat protein [Bacteroidaceae bacterium]|nr:tetratricopeptide repeat protein [Bacteroidaceae bacterium]
MNYDKGYFDSPEFREILKKYEQANRLNTTPYFGVDELIDLFSYFISMEKAEEATKVLSFTKHLHPGTSECTKMEIRLLLYRGEAQEAKQLFSTIRYTDDNETKLLYAEILLSLKEFKGARELALDILNNTKNGNDNSYEALEILLDCGLAHEALFICDNMLRIAPNKKNLLEVRAECLIEMQRTNEAVQIYNRLLDEDPYNTFYWEQLGHIYYMIKRYGKALECFEYESTINEEIEYAKMMQGYCYYHLRDYKHARDIFKGVYSKFPDSAVPLFYIALTYYSEGNKDVAKDYFNEVTNIAQEGTIEIMLARINKAIILDEQGETARGDEAMAMAILMHPDNMKQLVLGEHELYELRDKENLTFDDMNKLESKEWEQSEELYRLGQHLVKHNHLILAKRVFRYTREFYNDTSDIDSYIAYILWNTGEKEKIEPAVENALEGKSCILFELFNVPYNSNIMPKEFIAQITDKR